MTENEAKRPKIAIIGGGRNTGRTLKAHIELLEELESYRAIGTVEEFKALKEKEERFDRNIKMFNEIGLEIRNKAIDEFAEKCKEHIFCQTFGLKPRNIDEIAEELKGVQHDK